MPFDIEKWLMKEHLRALDGDLEETFLEVANIKCLEKIAQELEKLNANLSKKNEDDQE